MTRHITDAEIISSDGSYTSPEETATARTVVGCLRGTIAGCISLVCAMAGGIGVGLQTGLGLGLVTGIILFTLLLGVSIYLMNTAKQLTLVDCILPIPLGATSALLFAPVGLFAGSVFSAITCLGASFLLTIMLLMYRSKKIHGGWLLVPFLVFIYELLPIELPSDLDNFLSLGGDGVNCIAALIFSNNNNNLLE